MTPRATVIRRRLGSPDIGGGITTMLRDLLFNPFMPGGPKINLLFFDFLQLIAKKIIPFMLPLLTR